MQAPLNLNDRNEQNPRVLVCQVGARRRYAVARMFEDAGMLTALYTDSSLHSFLGKIAYAWGDKAPPKVRRLAQRSIIGVPKSKVFSTDYPLIRELISKWFKRKHDGVRASEHYSGWLAKKMIRKGAKGANIVYTMNCSSLAFVENVKTIGCRIVTDIFISPKTNAIMLEECKSFPGWGGAPSPDDLNLMAELWHRSFDLADILLCPSEWVAEGIREMAPNSAHKIRIVPYGCTIDYGGRTNKPIKGRVLFAGGDALRKGLPYLAQATTNLRKLVPDLDVRIAGQIPTNIVHHQLCHDLNFLGKLSPKQIKEEYLSADLFVLPSLSEGFAGVVAEAIGAGCPVVVTRESGSPIVHGREGLIVKARDADTLATAMVKILCNGQLRSDMAAACLNEFSFYSEAAWKKRLIDAVTI